MTKKKILVDVIALLYAQTGIRTYTLNLADTVLGIPEPNLEFQFVPKLSSIERLDFFKGKLTLWKKPIFHLFIFGWKQIILPLLVRVKHADILFCPDFVAPALLRKTKKIVVIHDAFTWKYPLNYGKVWRKYFHTMLLLGLKGRSLVLTVSNYAKNDVMKFIPKSTKLEVLYQYVQKVQIDTSVQELPPGLEKNKYILHVGFFDRRKNIPTLVQGFQKFLYQVGKDYKLVLVGGPGTNDKMDDKLNVEQLIDQLGISDKVQIHGHINTQLLTKLYADSFFCVFPSSDEGFGIPVLEAFRHQKPILVSDSGALKEIGGNAVIEFKTHDSDDLCNKMIELEASKELQKEMIQKGDLRLKEFSKEKFCNNLVEIIDRVIQTS